jgi:hypothetical protein
MRLSALRLIEEDQHDPYFTEALDQAAGELTLAKWCEDQRALDEIFARKLRELPVPDSLRRAFPGDESSHDGEQINL